MKIGDTIKAEIIDTNENGMGIARHDGMVVFVPAMLTGETAEVRIISVEKNYASGVCTERLTTSDDRITDLCPLSGECGGCTLGFVSYEAENRIKRNAVRAALRRAGLQYDSVSETVFAEARDSYRNKIVVHYDAGRRSFGYMREKSNIGIEFSGCLLCTDVMNDIILFTNKNTAILHDMKPTELHLRSSLDGITVSLYVGKYVKQAFDEFRNLLKSEFSTVNDVLYFSESGKHGEKQYIRDRIFGLDMNFTSEAFRQVNSAAFEKLLGIVHDFAAEVLFSCAADLYCGSGIIGLSLAKRFPNVRFWGIEINTDAVRDAQHNARANDIENISFFSGDAASFRKKIPSEERPELIVVDPPRAGLSKEMRADLVSLSPSRIIYVSCNPQTMARDAAELCKNGFTMRSVVPVNMFPRTKHCECVTVFDRSEVGR